MAVIQIHVFGNFYQIDQNAFRSGQLNAYNLPYYLKKHKIKTILNLRGENLKRDYYIDEKNIAEAADVALINFGMSNRKKLDFKTTSKLVTILKNAEKPILIHCAGGADRTSLVAALYQYTVAKQPIAVAKEEFSFWYGHVPWLRKHVIAMDQTFDNYLAHRP